MKKEQIKEQLEFNYFDLPLDKLDELVNVIIVTGMPEDTSKSDFKDTDECIQLVKKLMEDMFTQLIALMMPQTADKRFQMWFNRLRNHEIRWEFRSEIDLDGPGILIDGKVPLVHIHLGHGGKEGNEWAISPGNSETGEWVTESDYISHLEGGEGTMWLVLLPVCHGNDIAQSISSFERIYSSWGSVDEKPSTCYDALLDFVGEISRHRRNAIFTKAHSLK